VVSPDSVWEALERVCDPEYPVNIVDLGMVYGVEVESSAVRVRMTFTSIGCPAIEMLVDDVKRAIWSLPGVSQVQVEVVWNPPWTKERISERGRKLLAACGVTS
jgi:metal-sulfur cluster biosynthetic enzyme